jgi:hypothetical protein
MELGLLEGQKPKLSSSSSSAEPLGDWDAEIAAVKAQAVAWATENKGKIKTTWSESTSDHEQARHDFNYEQDGDNDLGMSEEIEFIPSPKILKQRPTSKSPVKSPVKSPSEKLLQKRRFDQGSDFDHNQSSDQDRSGRESLDSMYFHRNKRRHTLASVTGTETAKAAGTRTGSSTGSGWMVSRSARSRRQIVQAKWNRETKRVGAASITIVNELDDEEIPASIDPDKFEYVEVGPYRWYVQSPRKSESELEILPCFKGMVHLRTTTFLGAAALEIVVIHLIVNVSNMMNTKCNSRWQETNRHMIPMCDKTIRFTRPAVCHTQY